MIGVALIYALSVLMMIAGVIIAFRKVGI